MKRILFILSLLFLVSCSEEYAEIKSELSEISMRLDSLSNAVNEEISSLTEIVLALQQKDYVTSITPFYENGAEVGYEIAFFKNDPIVIMHGSDGNDGAAGSSPDLGVKQGEDGNWYWTLAGEWLLDENGKRLIANAMDGADGDTGADGTTGEGGKEGLAGNDGCTPQLKIIDNIWYLSVDGGNTWREYGPAVGEDGKDAEATVESIFSDVKWDQDYAYFYIRNGEVIALPIYKGFQMILDRCDSIPVAKGDTVCVSYVLTGNIAGVKIDCHAENGWKASVVETSSSAGQLVIRAPYPYVDGKVMVVASSDHCSNVINTLTFVEEEGKDLMMAYSYVPAELDGWSELLLFDDGTYIMGKPHLADGYLLSLGNTADENGAIVYLDSLKHVREIYADNRIYALNSYDDNGFEAMMLLSNLEEEHVDVPYSGQKCDDAGNLHSYLQELNALCHGTQTGLGFENLAIGLIDRAFGYIEMLGGPDLSHDQLTSFLRNSENVMSISEMARAFSKPVKELLKPAMTLYDGLYSDYMDLYNGHMERYYKGVVPTIEAVGYDGTDMTVKVNASSQSRDNLNVGVVVCETDFPLFDSDYYCVPMTSEVEYSFTVPGLVMGKSYQCWSFIYDDTREPLWFGWIAGLAGPFARFSDKEEVMPPIPHAYTGEGITAKEKSMTVACRFYDVPSDALCGIELENGKKYYVDHDKTEVCLDSLSSWTEYVYRSFIEYGDRVYYGAEKIYSTAPQDITGLWKAVETSEGKVRDVWDIILHEDHSATIYRSGETFRYESAGWSQSKTGFTVSISTFVPQVGSNNNFYAGIDFFVTYNDPDHAVYGEGTSRHWGHNLDTLGGYTNGFNLTMTKVIQ